jgi:hypothetical protein
MSAVEKLKELEIEIPPATPGVLAPAVRTGNLVYTSGACSAVTGKVGTEVTTEQGLRRRPRRHPALPRFVQWLIGDLNKITRVVKLLGMVNCAEGFSNTPAVIHGATDTLIEIFGQEKGGMPAAPSASTSFPGDAPWKSS